MKSSADCARAGATDSTAASEIAKTQNGIPRMNLCVRVFDLCVRFINSEAPGGAPESLNIEYVRAVYDCPNQLRLPKSTMTAQINYDCPNQDRAVIDRAYSRVLPRTSKYRTAPRVRSAWGFERASGALKKS